MSEPNVTHLPEYMLAVRVHGPSDLRVERVPVPELEAGDALLRVRAVGVCATDRKLVARGAPDGAVRVLGHEVVGDVVVAGSVGPEPGASVALAPNVGDGTCRACARGETNLCPNVRAFGIHIDGGMAEYVRVPRAAVEAGHLIPVPPGLQPVRAVLFEPLACCLEGFLATDLRPGDDVLVVACGVMGRLHVALARALGAGTIVAVDRYRARLDHARALGADVVAEGNGALETATAEATAGRGVDVVALTVGDASAASSALRTLARGGRMNLFGGFPHDAAEVAFDANGIHYGGLRVVGTTGASKTTLKRALALLAGDRLDVRGMVSATFSLADAERAFAAAAESAHARIVLVAQEGATK